MSTETASLPGNKTPIKNALTGLIALTFAFAIGIATVYSGSRIAYSQYTDPLLGTAGLLSAGVALTLLLIVTLIALMVGLGMLDAIAEPQLFGRLEYTLVGIGGLVGVAVGTLIMVLALTAPETVAAGLSVDGDVSLAAVAAATVPFALMFHEFYRPTLTSADITQPSEQEFDPEYVRDKTAQWSDDRKTRARNTKQQPQNRSNTRHIDQQDLTNQPGGTDEDPHLSGHEDVEPTRVDEDGDEADELTDLEFRWVSETDVDFDSVGGMSDLKTELTQDVIKPLTTHREKAEALGVSAPNIIFHGPPGTGKTFMAKALATEVGMPFAQLSGADVQSKWINESSQKVQALFREAELVAENAGGAVVFLDELDSVLKNRGSGSAHEEDNKVVNEFLNRLEDTGDHNIVFVGATNRLDALDDAGIRSGRFDKKVYVGKPDAEAREAILRAQLDERPHDVSKGVLEDIARETEGLVAADLELVVKNAAKNVLVRDGEGITGVDLREAVEDL